MASGKGDEGSLPGAVPLSAWAEEYVGRPFVDGEWDCWRLVVEVYRERRGVELPDYGPTSALDLREVAKRVAGERPRWREVRPAEDGDVALMTARVDGAGRLPVHVGVVVGFSRLLHVEEATGTVLVPLAHYTVARRIVGYYRYGED